MRETEWKVCLVRTCIYGTDMDGVVIASGPSISTAPKPAKLIPKGLFAVSFWVEVLLKKFEFASRWNGSCAKWRRTSYTSRPGTLTGGLEWIQKVLQPLAGQFVLHSREGNHWQMDETRWPMFCLVEGKGRQQWWFWVVVRM